MRKYKVVLYQLGSDDPVAEAYVVAEDAAAAHEAATRMVRQQFPDVDPENYNHLIAMDILWKAPAD